MSCITSVTKIHGNLNSEIKINKTNHLNHQKMEHLYLPDNADLLLMDHRLNTQVRKAHNL